MSVHAIAWAFDQEIKRSSQKFVLVALANFASSECGTCFPSTNTISDITSLDRKTVVECLDALESDGYIEDTKERKGATKQVKVYKLKASQNRNCSENGSLPFFPIKAPVFPIEGSQERDTDPLVNRQGTKEREGEAKPLKVEGLPELQSHIARTSELVGEIKALAKSPASVSGRRPATVEDALTRASMIGVLEQDCRDWYRDCEACDWKRGDGTPFDNWVRQLCIHRDKLAEKRAKGGSHSTATGKREPSIYDIKTVIQVKEEKAKALKDRHSVEGPVNTEWRDANAKTEYFALRKEIKILKSRMEGMV